MFRDSLPVTSNSETVMRRTLSLVGAGLLLTTSVGQTQTVDSSYFQGKSWRNIGPNRGGRSIAGSGSPSRPQAEVDRHRGRALSRAKPIQSGFAQLPDPAQPSDGRAAPKYRERRREADRWCVGGVQGTGDRSGTPPDGPRRVDGRRSRRIQPAAGRAEARAGYLSALSVYTVLPSMIVSSTRALWISVTGMR